MHRYILKPAFLEDQLKYISKANIVTVFKLKSTLARCNSRVHFFLIVSTRTEVVNEATPIIFLKNIGQHLSAN